MELFQKLNKEKLVELFDILEDTLRELKIEFYIIGALARDIIITGKYDILIPRKTLDVDIAVMIPEYEVFEELKKQLTEKGFSEHKTLGYRLFYKDIIILDLLPFGGIENSENIVKIYGKELSSLSVLGLNEIKNHTEIIEYSENKSFKVTTIPAICILKLISWNDKPTERIRDIDDFTFILSKYSDMYMDTIYENHYDLINGIWEPDIISARVLGRDIGDVLLKTPILKDKILKILTAHLKDEFTSNLAILMCSYNKKYVEDNFNILKELLIGIKERLKIY
jgi:predicted nucleotidyltransferase